MPERYRWFGRWRVGIGWQPRDLWVGAYYERTTGTAVDDGIDVWICVIPCVPIHIIRQENL